MTYYSFTYTNCKCRYNVRHELIYIKQLYDLLNGFIKDPLLTTCIKNYQGEDKSLTILDCIDTCLDTIIKTFNDNISKKGAYDVQQLLKEAKPIEADALQRYYGNDGSDVIFQELLEMATNLQLMNNVVSRQKMIYIPV